jgi:hypothetical protein
LKKFIILGITLLLFLPSTVLANSPIDISVSGTATDGNNSFDIQSITDIATFTVSGTPYAIVTDDNAPGVQIINLSDPANISVSDTETDGANGFTILAQPSDVATFTVSGTPYAIVIDEGDSGVQIINLSTPTAITASDAETDDNNGFTFFDTPRGVATFTVANVPYAIVVDTDSDDDTGGVQIINLSTPTAITASDAETDEANGFTQLGQPTDVATFTVGTTPYAIVTDADTTQTDGIQIINLGTPTAITASDAEFDENNGFTLLDNPTAVETFTVGGTPYAIVLSEGDNAVTIINLSDPTNITIADTETDDNNGFTILNAPKAVDIFTVDDIPYAILVDDGDDGVQIINLGTPTAITASDAETDGNNGFTLLGAPSAVATFTVGTTSYALVGDTTDGAIEVINLGTDSSTTTNGGGGSDNQHKTRPTFGIDPTTFRQLIEGGFSFNGKSHDITDNFWTPFAEQKVKIGTLNSFTTKVFADKQLQVQEFLFGIPEVGEGHKAELGVEVIYDYSGEVKAINVVQKTDIIDVDSIKVENNMSKCRSDDDTDRCVTTHLSMKFLEPLQDKVMALKAIDFKGRSQITYLNDGFDISGDSLNPMIVEMIASPEKYEGLIEVTQTAKYSDIWITDDGREFERNDYGSFTQINQSFENNSNLMDTRFSSDFADYKKSLSDKYAELLLESCPDCFTSFADFDDSFAYENIIDDLLTEDRLEGLSSLIEIEKQKAIQSLIDAELAITYPDYVIDTDDRPISVILAEERAMKKLLSDERAYLKQILSPQQ